MSQNLLFLSNTTKDGVTFEPFTPLPIPLNGHCMVKFDNGQFFIAGGYDHDNSDGSGGYSDRVFIYYMSGQWSEKSNMPTARECKRDTG